MSSPAVPCRVLALALGVLQLTGCMVPISFDAVAGPLAAQRPPPAYVAQIRDGVFGSGSQGHLAVALGNGEVFRGSWSPARTADSQDKPVSAQSSDPSLTRDWDAVYGAGFFSAHVREARWHARALLTGSGGSTAVVEVYSEHDVCGQTRGVARDSRGNLYRVTIYSDCGEILVRTLSNGPPTIQRPEPQGPRLVIFASGGPAVLATPVGGGLYAPVSGGPPQPAQPVD